MKAAAQQKEFTSGSISTKVLQKSSTTHYWPSFIQKEAPSSGVTALVEPASFPATELT